MPGAQFKGRLTVVERKYTKLFQFNPETISETKGVEYGITKVPGMSHPVVQFGAGGEEILSFTLFFDGDRGRLGQDHPDGLNIKKEIDFYRAMKLPVAVTGGIQMKAVYPYVLMFNYGELYKNYMCVIRKADPKWTFMVGKGIPMRAELNLELLRLVSESESAMDVYDFGFGNQEDDGGYL